MSANSENQINLKTLQRVDSNIIEIIDNTSQVAIYKYERKLEQWEGTDVEGTLFLYRRSCSPFHGFIIVNRMNTTNFVESITSDMQFQLQQPYLLYKNTSDDIIGCWFYEHKDLKRISKKIQTIVLKQASSCAPRRQRCASESETTREDSAQDIITLLSQAHEKYMRNVSQPKEPKIENNNNNNAADVNNQHLEKRSRNTPPRCAQESSFVSPRRRFLSAGSFDSRQTATLYGRSPNENNAFVTGRGDFRNGSGREKGVSSRLFPVFGRDEAVTLSSAGAVDVTRRNERRDSAPNGVVFGRKLLFNNLEPPEKPDWKTSADKDAHFTSMKQVLKSNIQDNPKLMLQIHEAYISSLRSLLNKI